MILLADENLNHRFINALRNAGFEVRSVAHEIRGASDLTVSKFAVQENAIVLTEDKDFGELVFSQKIADVSVIFLRYSKPELDLTERLLLQAVNQFSTKKGRFFITISRAKIRVSEL